MAQTGPGLTRTEAAVSDTWFHHQPPVKLTGSHTQTTAPPLKQAVSGDTGEASQLSGVWSQSEQIVWVCTASSFLLSVKV